MSVAADHAMSESSSADEAASDFECGTSSKEYDDYFNYGGYDDDCGDDDDDDDCGDDDDDDDGSAVSSDKLDIDNEDEEEAMTTDEDDINDDEEEYLSEAMTTDDDNDDEEYVPEAMTTDEDDNNDDEEEDELKTRLHILIDQGESGLAIDHLERNPSDASVQDGEGWTPLHILVTKYPIIRHFKMLLHALLEAFLGATTCRDGLGYTPFHLLLTGDLILVQDWFAQGFLKNLLDAEPAAASMEDTDGMLPLHTLMTVSVAEVARADDVLNDAGRKIVQLLLDTHPEAIKVTDKTGMLPLHHLCRSEGFISKPLLTMILQAYPEAAFVEDDNGRLPLEHVVRCCSCCTAEGNKFHLPAVKLMEANPGAIFKPDPWGETPLDHFLKEITESLFAFENSPCKNRGDIGWEDSVLPAICRSLEWLNAKFVLKIAKHGKTRMERGVKWRMLHAAVTFGCPPNLLTCIVDAYSKHLLREDRDGNVPLTLAASNPDWWARNDKDEHECCLDEENNCIIATGLQIVLQACPRAAKVHNSEGRLPLHLAVESGKEWTAGVQDLMQAAPEALSTRDTATHMYPFMIAAGVSQSSVSTCYELLRACPELVRRAIPN